MPALTVAKSCESIKYKLETSVIMTKPTPLALLPLLLFLVLFVGSGLWYQSQGVDFAFYQIQAPVAILPALVLAILLSRGELNKRIDTFMKGVGDQTIITMVLIYLLAGAFASVAKSIGGVDATVNFGLSIIPTSFILPGIFIITAFSTMHFYTLHSQLIYQISNHIWIALFFINYISKVSAMLPFFNIINSFLIEIF